ncbi:tyrosine-protein phosphatase [Propioniciclava sp.]|uniref:tyrosine-protein phosphatase n=1 Tax=Propioniciclava sp. TaxID=2038686 RepID=UPI00260DE194|nr:tyrosine-protein phosphatase [Propioniciclava sp.]
MTPRLALMGLRIDGMSNLRDLGGTPTADGGRIQPGRLWRSENQTGLSADSRRAMIASGLTDVVDLRTSYECAASPSPFVDEPEVVYHQHSYFLEEIDAHADVLHAAVPWLGGDDFGTQTTDDGANSYLLFLALRPDSVLAALRAVAGASGAALVHCAVGRDRTGFTVALALALVGAPDEAIAADYAETSRHLEGVLRALWSDEAYASTRTRRPRW